MTRITTLNTSLFPDFPREKPVVDHHGNFTQIWHLQLSILFQTLQRNYTNEGIKIPQLDESEIDTIEARYKKFIGQPLPKTLEDITSQMVFDITNRVPKIFIITYVDNNPAANVVTAEWKTFTLT